MDGSIKDFPWKLAGMQLTQIDSALQNSFGIKTCSAVLYHYVCYISVDVIIVYNELSTRSVVTGNKGRRKKTTKRSILYLYNDRRSYTQRQTQWWHSPMASTSRSCASPPRSSSICIGSGANPDQRGDFCTATPLRTIKQRFPIGGFKHCLGLSDLLTSRMQQDSRMWACVCVCHGQKAFLWCSCYDNVMVRPVTHTEQVISG